MIIRILVLILLILPSNAEAQNLSYYRLGVMSDQDCGYRFYYVAKDTITPQQAKYLFQLVFYVYGNATISVEEYIHYLDQFNLDKLPNHISNLGFKNDSLTIIALEKEQLFNPDVGVVSAFPAAWFSAIQNIIAYKATHDALIKKETAYRQAAAIRKNYEIPLYMYQKNSGSFSRVLPNDTLYTQEFARGEIKYDETMQLLFRPILEHYGVRLLSDFSACD